MIWKRRIHSLSGLLTQLAAIGGVTPRTETLGERYLVRTNKWVRLPALNSGHDSHAIILLQSTMYILSEEGQPEEDLSESSRQVPKRMN